MAVGDAHESSPRQPCPSDDSSLDGDQLQHDNREEKDQPGEFGLRLQYSTSYAQHQLNIRLSLMEHVWELHGIADVYMTTWHNCV